MTMNNLKQAYLDGEKLTKTAKDEYLSVAEDDRWITIHPNGEENKGQPLHLDDGQTPAQAMKQKFGERFKEKKSDNLKEDERKLLDSEKEKLKKRTAEYLTDEEDADMKKRLENRLKELDDKEASLEYVLSENYVSENISKKDKEKLEKKEGGKELLEEMKKARELQEQAVAEKDIDKKEKLTVEVIKKRQEIQQKRKEIEEKAAQKKAEPLEKLKQNGFEVKEERDKAALISKDGKSFWIQKRMINKDGELTPAGKEAFKNAQTDEERKADWKAKQERRKIGVVPPKPNWESEKALGYDLDLDFYDIEKNRRHRIFIPKSVIQENGNIPTWILEKKIEEIEDAYPSSKWGGFLIDGHPFKGYNLGSKDMTRYDYDDVDTQDKAIDETVYAYDTAKGLYEVE